MNTGRAELMVAAGVATLTLSSSDRMNVFDVQMRDQLIEALKAVADLPEVTAVVVSAKGPHFGAGADLREFSTELDSTEARWIRRRRDPWQLLWELPAVTVCALHGVAMGSALEIALLCDIRVCHPTARLALPETILGLLPGAGGTQSLARVLRPAQALAMIALGRELSGKQALEIGLVDRVCADPAAEAHAVANRLAASPASVPAALALRAAVDEPLGTGLQTERRLASVARSADGFKRWRAD